MAALGDDLPQCGTDPKPTTWPVSKAAGHDLRQPATSALRTPPPQPDLRNAAGGRGAILRDVRAVTPGEHQGKVRLSDRSLPYRLWHCSHHWRVLPSARRVSGLSDWWRDDGPIAVYPNGACRSLADPADALMERLDAFMARASVAYYATHDPFRDFTTSPEITQVFGEILGLWAAVAWQHIGSPDPVLLVEAGPGRGTLMADALRAIRRAAPAFAAPIRLHLIETSRRLRAIQLERLPEGTWHDSFDSVPEAPFVLLANQV